MISQWPVVLTTKITSMNCYRGKGVRFAFPSPSWVHNSQPLNSSKEQAGFKIP